MKTARLDCAGQICFYWWPRLTSMPGWHTDEAANFGYGDSGMNSLVPDGATFANAETIMYGSATYRPRYETQNPGSKSLSAFISADKAFFASEHPGMSITEVAPLTTGDGQKLRSFAYFRPGDQTWEQVSYGVEGDFYLVFTLSARTEAAYRKGQTTYVELIGRYRK